MIDLTVFLHMEAWYGSNILQEMSRWMYKSV